MPHDQSSKKLGKSSQDWSRVSRYELITSELRPTRFPCQKSKPPVWPRNHFTRNMPAGVVVGVPRLGVSLNHKMVAPERTECLPAPISTLSILHTFQSIRFRRQHSWPPVYSVNHLCAWVAACVPYCMMTFNHRNKPSVCLPVWRSQNELYACQQQDRLCQYCFTIEGISLPFWCLYIRLSCLGVKRAF